MATSYDLIVIGAGPGGYNCGIRAGQLGLKALVIERRANEKLGGTCLNVGCIPSKALLHASERFEEARDHLSAIGVKTKGVELDLKAMMKHKDKSVDGLTKGIEYLFKKNKVDHVFGTGKILKPGHVEVTKSDGTVERFEGKNIVIATGSEPAAIPGIDIDEERVVSSTGAIALNFVPDRMVVIGGGYIGLELGSVWRRLGAEVTVVEYLDRITPGMDAEISKMFLRILKKQGMTFKLSTKVVGVETKDSGVQVTVQPADAAGGDAMETLEADVVLVSIGRRPATDGLGAAEAGVEIDERGFVKVGAHYETTADGIYAIGDVIGGAMLAHKAEDEAVAVAELIAGQAGHVNYDAIPAVVYTWPEVATVGKTEEQLKEAGIAYKVGKFPFSANSRARTVGESDGAVKVLADADTDRVLGVHMIGPNVGEMIAEAALAMEFSAASEDIARTSHPHPTLTEAIRQAAMDVDGRVMQS